MISQITGFFTQTETHYSDYEYTDYKRYLALISTGCEHVYSELPDVDEVHTFLWANKEWIIGGVAISGVALIAIRYFRSRPQYPIVNMQSTLNYARLSIEIPKKKEVIPPNITLAFCIDTSSSMNGEREEAVKAGVNDVLNSAQKVVKTLQGANVKIAIVGFNQRSTIICEPTMVTEENGENSPIEKIRANLNGYSSSRGTSIIAGLEKATAKLEGMARENKKGEHTLILLTDGEDSLDQSKVALIQTRLAAANANLFAIGIGERHKKDTLRKIAPETGKFTGTYIDTTLGKETIGSAISKIYTQAIAVFSDLVLRSPQLSAGTWSVDNIPSVMTNKQSECKLGSLSGETKMVRRIQIHSDKLKSPLDLSPVRFDLTFKDPKGREGKLSLPWKSNSIIDPQILSDATNNLNLIL